MDRRAHKKGRKGLRMAGFTSSSRLIFTPVSLGSHLA